LTLSWGDDERKGRSKDGPTVPRNTVVGDTRDVRGNFTINWRLLEGSEIPLNNRSHGLTSAVGNSNRSSIKIRGEGRVQPEHVMFPPRFSKIGEMSSQEGPDKYSVIPRKN